MEDNRETVEHRNELIHYVLTLSIVILAVLSIGSFPLLIALQSKSIDLTTLNENTDYVALFGANAFLSFNLFPFIVGFFVLLVCVKLIHRHTIQSLFTSRLSFDWKRFFFSFSIWGGVMSVLLLISIYTVGNIDWNFNPLTFFMLLLIALFILPIQTSFEEILFRGYLFRGFRHALKKGVFTVLITGILFGSLHFANPEVQHLGYTVLIFYIMNGVFLGLIVLMDDGLELSLGYHAANNIFAVIIVTNKWQAFTTDALFMDNNPPSFGMDNILTLVIIQPLLILLFARKYKWSNWKEKLFGNTKGKLPQNELQNEG